VRSQAEQDALWQHIFDGTLPMVTSDHSPAPASMKTDANFFNVWGGISGCQSTLSVLLTDGHARRGLPLETIAALLAENVARRFRLPQKGRIAIGMDADLALIDMAQQFTLDSGDLFYRHQHSPYVGRTFSGRVVRTLLRGTTVFQDGKIMSKPAGRLLRPKA
jgi:allantoinase